MESVISRRLKSNLELVSRLEAYLKTNPEVRFSQALQELGLVRTVRPVKVGTVVDWKNEFYTEPEDILDRVYMMIRKEA
jgi:hypothetical protein